MKTKIPLLLLLALTAINGSIVAYRYLRQLPLAPPSTATASQTSTHAAPPMLPANPVPPAPKTTASPPAVPSTPASRTPAKPSSDQVAMLDKKSRSLPPLPGSSLTPKGIADYILVEKKARRLTLLHNGNPLKTYEIALGQQPEGPKRFQGDNKTPEGLYRISFRKKNSEFHRALQISYPNPTDVAFAAKQHRSAGGDIMIHGLPKGMDWLDSAHRLRDWTAGCIAVTNAEIEEIWSAVPNGTLVEIRP